MLFLVRKISSAYQQEATPRDIMTMFDLFQVILFHLRVPNKIIFRPEEDINNFNFNPKRIELALQVRTNHLEQLSTLFNKI